MTSETSLIVQSLPFAILVLDATPDFVIRHASDEYLAATRTRRADLIDRPLFEAFPAPSAAAEGPARLRASLELVLGTGRTHAMEVLRYDVPDRDGGGFIAKHWLPTNIPVPGEDGSVRFILHRVYDLTAILASEDGRGPGSRPAHLTRSLQDLRQLAELMREGEGRRRNAEARATEAGERLELAVAAGELGTFYCPMPMGKIFWNDKCKEHFFLPQDAEVDFDIFYSRIHPDDRERTRAAVAASVEDKKMYDVEYRVRAPDGRERWLRAKGRTYFDQGGVPTRFDGITIDISDTKRIETELARSNQQKDDFLAMLAHELRNPLAPISAGAQLLQSGNASPQAVERTAGIIVRQVTHMTRLVDDLLDVSRVTRGLVTLTRVPLNVTDVIADAVEQADPMMRAKQHRFELALPETPLQVMGDHKRLVQVLVNVLNNAAKYTPAGGTIRLQVRAEAERVKMIISDNGIGMSEELRGRVFELFAQADRNPDRSQGGLGLGLALVKTLVELHGGTVSVDSGGDQKGSTFTITLPGSAGPQPPPSAKPVPKPQTRLRVLVVDDNIDAAQTLQLLLETVGHEVFVAHTAHAGLEIAQAIGPQLCLLDIGLPDISGNDLARGLRQLPQTANATLVAVTGYGRREDKELARDAGFDHYFVKPLDVDGLLAVIATLH